MLHPNKAFLHLLHSLFPSVPCDDSACTLMGTLVFLEVELGQSAPVLATQRSCVLPGDREGQRRAPVATRHTCTRQFGSGPLCDGWKSVYELQSVPVKHIILPGLPLLQK